MAAAAFYPAYKMSTPKFLRGSELTPENPSDPLYTITRGRYSNCEGTDGVVYRARMMLPGGRCVDVALKVAKFLDEAKLTRFKRECDVYGKLAALNLPFFLPLLAKGAVGKIPFQVFPWGGPDLLSELSTRKFTLEESFKFLFMTALFLKVLHENGWVYTDLKEENLLVKGDSLFPIDLGCARQPEDSNPSPRGTLPSASPEVILRTSPRPAEDLFAAGCVFVSIAFPPSLYPPFQDPTNRLFYLHAAKRLLGDNWVDPKDIEQSPVKADYFEESGELRPVPPFDMESLDTKLARLSSSDPSADLARRLVRQMIAPEKKRISAAALVAEIGLAFTLVPRPLPGGCTATYLGIEFPASSDAATPPRSESTATDSCAAGAGGSPSSEGT